MKKIFLLLLSIIVMNCVSAQPDESEVLTPPKKTYLRMGGAGGFTSHVLFWKVSDINSSFSGVNVPKIQDKPLILSGGQGYGYIMFLENLRIGGMGAGGGVTSSLVIQNTRYDLETKVNFGGVTIDYVFPVTERFDIVAGGIVGWGGMNVKMRRDTWGIKKWDSLVDSWAASGTSFIGDFYYTLKGSFFIYQPAVNFEYAILRWLGIRLGVSYLGMASPSWQLDEKFDVVGVPDKLKGNGLMINGGVFLGTFLF
ncbi:MAG: hypothetical protein Q8K98_03915 [Bacteroidota bacterium]|nr:hypothetical protein [Bacteroidota bacterium]